MAYEDIVIYMNERDTKMDYSYNPYKMSKGIVKKVDKEIMDIGKGKHGHPDFYALLADMANLHSRKNHDYAGEDPLSNFRMCESLGVPAHIGAFIRLGDKYKRCSEFFRGNVLNVPDETVEDTLIDLAVYSLICILLHRERGTI